MKNKNRYEFANDICIGYTNNGERFIFDTADFDKIKVYVWHINSNGYVCSQAKIDDGTRKHFTMHRLLMGFPDKEIIDHINGDKADNRRMNLRACSREENCRNVRSHNYLGLKGVSLTRQGTYQAQIYENKHLKYLGSYKTITEASKAYDKEAIKIFGEFAHLNRFNCNITLVEDEELQDYINSLNELSLPSKSNKENAKYCIGCGCKIHTNSKRCVVCSGISRRKTKRPSRIELKRMIRNNSFLSLSNQLGVTDNAIRKWCKAYNLPYKSKYIKSISDKEWDKI